ncbi:MAG: threonine--tRNA ligase [Candidatus Raymondbacteria bacterium RifOxyA12_full_50_37]|nr:MAG: threonine--tRNA ligase [Candidatus Raymondbacteria bacterium RifOxyB12_full_50_8]OGJ90846.1 MAG: threonine--tRNA ligase [Candidatus Raymondbacteria bacterium RifOxyA12_full_50_37]OGJ93947.1 MAG: threonine--tRNA ligase [Candidatus Raymondbacteria bacterium RIFOXYA2_FULL_49_16]OGJ98184.1 MAG: threonine--tRNA ligase [Candidatus Raymondbacteria bacterium RIFOXYC2_FULL_50_21]OGP45453.1 MAG: threonine--tRNA ligase [Candidatus Raymondbacteria bacterium RIFOXYB2_FULL_49_35]
MNVKLPDGSTRVLADHATAMDLALSISEGLARASVAARVNGSMRDLSAPLSEGAAVELVKFDSDGGKQVFWHTASHIMAQAVKSLWPNVKIAIGPSIDAGFYYDFDTQTPISNDDFPRIEAKMKEIIAQNLPLSRRELSKEEARAYFSNLGETYKDELIRDLPDGETISVYSQGEFTDLCRGPHLPHTGLVKSVKLLSIAGAYWRGSEKNAMLQRIYGIAFPAQKQLDEYLLFLEEAKKRDHRNVGRTLDLFSQSEQVGPGLVLWHPNGGRLRTLIEDYWRQEHYKNGYEIVYSPHIGRATLWETSGHLDFYKENMYAAMEIDEQEYYVKPMNCPFHIVMYKSALRSYRDLPLRWAELGTVYRYEKSGVLHGLLRVRGFTQDDAHIICRPDQMPEEIRKVLRFCLHILKAFGFETFAIYLATKPKEKSVGDQAMWDDATAALAQAVKDEGLVCAIDEGGGAFYGPKIDIKIKDALNREWQCSTIQFDFNLPERFDMTYAGSNNDKQRPYMIHRALLGSMERFMGVLIEHYAGDLPLWLAPQQAMVIPVSQKFVAYAESVHQVLVAADLRASVDYRDEKIGYKIREAENNKIPYMLIVGEKECVANTVSLRKRKKGDAGACALSSVIEDMQKEIREKAIP